MGRALMKGKKKRRKIECMGWALGLGLMAEEKKRENEGKINMGLFGTWIKREMK